jgi:hypothetical protein
LALSPSAAANRRIGLFDFKPEITPLPIPTNFAPLPVNETSIVPNLVSITLDGLHNVQVVVAADSTQHDVADGEARRVYGATVQS